MSTGTGTMIQSPTSKRKRSSQLGTVRKARTLDREKAQALRAAGYSMPAIAKELGVTCGGVYKFLNKAEPAHRALEAFKANRANVFADLQRAAIELQMDIIKSFKDANGVLLPLTDSQKSGLLGSLNAVSGTIYDKERLELGKSTSNVGVLQRIMGSALSEAHKEGEKAPDPTPIEGKR